SLFSSINERYKDTIINIIMREKGKAAIINMFCKASNPPLYSKIIATADCATPHVIFTWFGGVSDPFVVCIPSTNVAESADVIKNVTISANAIIDKMVAQGN